MAELRYGFTTGTCAAIATKAALLMVFEQEKICREEVMTPKGISISTEIYDAEFSSKTAKAGVKKDAGDDPDVTNGIMVYSSVSLRRDGKILIDGGIGVGRVTKKGLCRNVGEAAINEVPLKMIREVAEKVLQEYDYTGGVDILISVPEGVEIAKRTFNPRLGIEGGISILGSSGIVEPMSEQAIIDTIKVEIDVKRAEGTDTLLMAPGNYGVDFIREKYGLDLDAAVKCSNYVGEAVSYAKKAGFKKILLIGHVGKFVKLAGGIMNTHSNNADCRMEILSAAAAYHTEDVLLLRRLLECVTTDEALECLKAAGLIEKVMQIVLDKAMFYLDKRAGGETEIEIVMYSKVYGVLAESNGVCKLISVYKGVSDEIAYSTADTLSLC